MDFRPKTDQKSARNPAETETRICPENCAKTEPENAISGQSRTNLGKRTPGLGRAGGGAPGWVARLIFGDGGRRRGTCERVGGNFEEVP